MPNGKSSRRSKSRRNKGKHSGRPSPAGGGGVRGFLPQPSLFPPARWGTHLYDGVFTLAPAASAIAYNTFRINSVWDPDFTGVGTTVTGYTSMAALYNRYRVVCCSAHITFVTAATTPVTAFAVASSTNTVGTSYTSIMSQKNSWTAPIGNVNTRGLTHRFKMPVHTVYGTSRRAVLEEDDWAGLTGVHPNNAVYLHVGVLNNTGTAATGIQILVRLTMNTRWDLPLLTAL